jgi:hypothetical protein
MNSVNTALVKTKNKLQNCSLKYKLLVLTVCTTIIVRFSKSDLFSFWNFVYDELFTVSVFIIYVMCFGQIFRMIERPSIPWLSSTPVLRKELVMTIRTWYTSEPKISNENSQVPVYLLFVCKHK